MAIHTLFFFICLCTINISYSFGQSQEGYEQMPEFPGGNIELYKLLQKRLHLSKEEASNIQNTKVIVQFIITKEGKLKDPIILKSLNKSFDERLLALLYTLPDWKPALQNGMPIDYNFLLPIIVDIRY